MKYNYTNPIMKQVAELCDKGHWPICESGQGNITIFTPIRDERGRLRRSLWEELQDTAMQNVGYSYHEDSDTQPTKIIGFWHPPTPQFDVGDKVKVRSSRYPAEVLEKAINYYKVGWDNGNTDHHHWSDLEPVLPTEPLELTLEAIAEKFGTTADNIKIKK
jgi:hypothetical protein